MDKLMEEEDLKGLEKEIDNAVDRLFVEKKRGPAESFLMESPPVEPPSKPPVLEPPVKAPVLESPAPVLESPMKPHPLEPSIQPPVLEPSVKPSLLEPSYEFEKSFDLEKSLNPPPAPRAPSGPIPFSKSIEKMEAQLLSLEWEITGEKLQKTKEEVLALKELLKQKADISPILSSMEEVLNHMIKNEEDIQPAWIKFLLDSKETIKLLMRKETEGEIHIYKQLAHLGIEARFSCLEGMKDTKVIQPSLREGEVEESETSVPGEKKIEEVSKNVNLFMKRVEEIFRTMQQQIFRLEETTRMPPAPPVEARSAAVNITIFKINEKLFGVESEKVFKLFKVPNTFQEKYSDQAKIRLRDFEVKMVDLKKALAIEGGRPKEQIRILTVKEDGEYKGFMVDQVLKKLSTLSERGRGAGGYFSGVIHITYQEQPVEIPILDLKKF